MKIISFSSRINPPHPMKTKFEYDPTQYSEQVNLLIMLKAEQWKVPPSEALVRLLDELAARELKTAA